MSSTTRKAKPSEIAIEKTPEALYVAIDREGISKEQGYFTVSCVWRGSRVELRVEADRYRHSSGMSEWRISMPNSGLTDTAYAAIRPAVVPFIEQWLASPALYAARAEGLYYELRRNLRDERYSLDGFDRLLAQCEPAMNRQRVTQLKQAAQHLRAFLAMLDV